MDNVLCIPILAARVFSACTILSLFQEQKFGSLLLDDVLDHVDEVVSFLLEKGLITLLIFSKFVRKE